MAAPQLFLPQEAVDTWLADGAIQIDGNDLRMPSAALILRLQSALLFTEEVAEGNDGHDLVGKVKTLEAVTAMDGEHFADSVVLGDHAYQVVEGFLGEVLAGPEGGADRALRGWLEAQA